MKRYKFTKTFTYDGKRYYIRANSELELGMKYQKRLEDLKANHVIINSNMTLGDWARKCVETYKTSSSEDARDRYLDFTEKYIVSEIGHYKLKDVRPIMCQSLINKYEGMSKYTIGQVYQKLNFIFRKAVDNGLINSNPAADISKPTGTLNKRRSLTSEEQEIFVKCALKHQYAIYFMLIYELILNRVFFNTCVDFCNTFYQNHSNSHPLGFFGSISIITILCLIPFLPPKPSYISNLDFRFSYSSRYTKPRFITTSHIGSRISWRIHIMPSTRHSLTLSSAFCFFIKYLMYPPSIPTIAPIIKSIIVPIAELHAVIII